MGRRLEQHQRAEREAWEAGYTAALQCYLGQHEGDLRALAGELHDVALLVRATLDQALGEGIPQELVRQWTSAASPASR